MKNRSWAVVAAAVATGGVTLAAALWIDALRTGDTEGGLRADPRGAASPSASHSAPASERPASPSTSKCVGTRPVGSLPGPPGAEGESPDDTPLFRLLAHVDRLAATRHAAVFTGLAVDEAHRAADVWRIPSAAFDRDVCGAAEKGVTVRLHDTDANRGDLDALADRISEDMHRWDGTFELREVAVDERGFVHVGVDDPDKAEPVIRKTFGDEHIKVTYVDQAELGLPN